MAKTQKPIATIETNTSGFPVPFTLDEFRKDIVEVFFQHVRTIAWITDPKTAWKITGLDASGEMNDILSPERSGSELGLTYEQIRTTPFASALEHMYGFAFFGRRDASAESMEYESYYMWLADLVCDAMYGNVSMQWDSYGLDITDRASRCVLVVETANARNVLEGGEAFSYFSNGPARGDSVGFDGSLTIRQMALLSGMEEMSIRSAANPKRANPLKTHTEDGGTRVNIEVAKEWLQSKGRYVPITLFYSASDVDLTKRRFSDFQEIWFALNARFLMIAGRDGETNIEANLAEIGLEVKSGFSGRYLDIDDSSYANDQMVRSLAQTLELPADLLVLRCKELVTSQQLADIEKQLRQAVSAAGITTSI
jgi:hypothetical protein